MITWEDGVHLKKPKFTMTGFTAKRVSGTKLAKEVQTKVLQMWVEQKTQEKSIITFMKHILPLEMVKSYGSIVKRSRRREDRFMLKRPDCKRHQNVMIRMKWCDRCGKDAKDFVTPV